MTQHELILKHLDECGSISPFEAFESYGITKLATRISELKKQGYHFTTMLVQEKNRFGEPVKFARYWRAK